MEEAFGIQGPGARILIISLERDQLGHALKFQFNVLNNEVEYEALIVEFENIEVYIHQGVN